MIYDDVCEVDQTGMKIVDHSGAEIREIKAIEGNNPIQSIHVFPLLLTVVIPDPDYKPNLNPNHNHNHDNNHKPHMVASDSLWAILKSPPPQAPSASHQKEDSPEVQTQPITLTLTRTLNIPITITLIGGTKALAHPDVHGKG